MDESTWRLTENSARIAFAKVMSEAVRIKIEEHLRYNRDVDDVDEITDEFYLILNNGPTGSVERATWEWALTVLTGLSDDIIATAFEDLVRAIRTTTFNGSAVTGPYCRLR